MSEEILRDKIEKILIKKRQYSGGVSVVNCIAHNEKPYSERPNGCDLCQSDRTNFLLKAERINHFLNGLLDDIEIIIKGQPKLRINYREDKQR